IGIPSAIASRSRSLGTAAEEVNADPPKILKSTVAMTWSATLDNDAILRAAFEAFAPGNRQRRCRIEPTAQKYDTGFLKCFIFSDFVGFHITLMIRGHYSVGKEGGRLILRIHLTPCRSDTELIGNFSLRNSSSAYPSVLHAAATGRSLTSDTWTSSPSFIRLWIDPLRARSIPPRRSAKTARISATIDRAISAGVFAPRSKPAGA